MSQERKESVGTVMLRNVRGSFLSLFKAKPFNDGEGEPKFQANFLMYKGTSDGDRNIRACEAAIDAIIREYEDEKGKRFPDLEDLDKKNIAYRSGENKRGEALYEGYENCMFVSARNSRRPLVIDRDKTPLVEEDGRPYSGCIMNAKIRFWVQDNKYGKALRCSLESVQFVKDGEAFGPQQATADDFDDLDEDEGQSSRAGSRETSRARTEEPPFERESRRPRDDEREVRRPRDGERSSRASSRGRRDDEDENLV